MCGDGGLRDENGNQINPGEIRSQNSGLKIIQAGDWTWKFGTVKEYVNWAKKQKSLTEEIIENL